MKKLIVFILILFLSGFLFPATICIPNICGDWDIYKNVKKLNIVDGVLFFTYNGKQVVTSMFVIKEE